MSKGMLLIGALVSSCGPGNEVVCGPSPCGETTYTPLAGSLERGAFDPAPDTCSRLEALEAYVVGRVAGACERLTGTSITLRGAGPESDGGYWTDPRLGRVGGLMDCDGRIVVLGDDFSTNALVHEWLHVLECPAPDETHETWADAGYWDIVAGTKRR